MSPTEAAAEVKRLREKNAELRAQGFDLLLEYKQLQQDQFDGFLDPEEMGRNKAARTRIGELRTELSRKIRMIEPWCYPVDMNAILAAAKNRNAYAMLDLMKGVRGDVAAMVRGQLDSIKFLGMSGTGLEWMALDALLGPMVCEHNRLEEEASVAYALEPLTGAGR